MYCLLYHVLLLCHVLLCLKLLQSIIYIYMYVAVVLPNWGRILAAQYVHSKCCLSSCLVSFGHGYSCIVPNPSTLQLRWPLFLWSLVPRPHPPRRVRDLVWFEEIYWRFEHIGLHNRLMTIMLAGTHARSDFVYFWDVCGLGCVLGMMTLVKKSQTLFCLGACESPGTSPSFSLVCSAELALVKVLYRPCLVLELALHWQLH